MLGNEEEFIDAVFIQRGQIGLWYNKSLYLDDIRDTPQYILSVNQASGV